MASKERQGQQQQQQQLQHLAHNNAPGTSSASASSNCSKSGQPAGGNMQIKSNGFANDHGDEPAGETSFSADAPKRDLINTMLPKELILKIFSFLDIVSLCRCAQVSKDWNKLALSGDNWQSVDLFSFRGAVRGQVVANLSARCGDFLKHLTLRGCQSVSDSSMQTFSKNCRNLEVIDLDDCKQLTDETCKSLAANCHKLSHLIIASCNVTDASLEAIGEGCKQLVHINISNCNKIRFEGIAALAKGCRELVSFIAVACGEATINDSSIVALADHCHKLKVINLNGCQGITDYAVEYLADNCRQLRYCCLSKCFALTDLALLSLGERCSQLKTLGLTGCHQLTDYGFQMLSKGCRNLQDLDLEDCVLISDFTLLSLTEYCPKLKRLALSHCDQITDQGIKFIGESPRCAESLQYLELDNCTQLTDASIYHLMSCKQLKRLDIFDNNRISREAIKKLYTYLPQLAIKTYFPTPTPQEQAVTEARHRYCRCCSIL